MYLVSTTLLEASLSKYVSHKSENVEIIKVSKGVGVALRLLNIQALALLPSC